MPKSLSQQSANRRWLENNRERWNAINLRSYHRLKEAKQTFRALANLCKLFE